MAAPDTATEALLPSPDRWQERGADAEVARPAQLRAAHSAHLATLSLSPGAPLLPAGCGAV